ncbi:hypothetical protein BJ875DRAFT_488255 [Amylocarpus encephaloides]|uniref:2EXR domain-containing protein n=1 Tax=Amylocarpus encephaloides TaxID=45428 RepID=A0A9P8C2N4_9HELO|nr:hypothetical protein BJ875DRAFT_488255 [Amylocarpus encephaloides]
MARPPPGPVTSCPALLHQAEPRAQRPDDDECMNNSAISSEEDSKGAATDLACEDYELSEFTYFPQLPAELRLAIWKFAIEGIGGRLINPRHAPADAPGVFQACHESRAEMTRRGWYQNVCLIQRFAKDGASGKNHKDFTHSEQVCFDASQRHSERPYIRFARQIPVSFVRDVLVSTPANKDEAFGLCGISGYLQEILVGQQPLPWKMVKRLAVVFWRCFNLLPHVAHFRDYFILLWQAIESIYPALEEFIFVCNARWEASEDDNFQDGFSNSTCEYIFDEALKDLKMQQAQGRFKGLKLTRAVLLPDGCWTASRYKLHPMDSCNQEVYSGIRID